MNGRYDMNQTSAQMLLGLLYPELSDKWIVRMKGGFYRNYNEDAMEVDPDGKTVVLSRGSMLDLLPSGIFSYEGEIRASDAKARDEEIHKRIDTVREAFVPLDSVIFHNSVRADIAAREAMESGTAFLLKTYFGFDIEAEENPYIRRVAPMLLNVKALRGDISFIRLMLSILTGCRVLCRKGWYSGVGTDRCRVPAVWFDIVREGLSAEEYAAEAGLIEELADFIREWFVPFDVHCEIALKDARSGNEAGERRLLNYNAHI